MTQPTSPIHASNQGEDSPGWGRYLLEEQLAAGGMGVVWRAIDRSTGAQIALKRLTTEGAHAGAALHAFQREYQVLKGISHPRIIRVFDYGVDEVGPYYTMELLGGHDLRVAAPVAFPLACSYLRDVATSLALLHARKFVHRDISPANVRVTPDGHCKLLDFGALAPFGPARFIMGTAPMVPPEALRGDPLDQRSDLYALGALGYWIVSGRHAYAAKTLSELPKRWQNVPPSLATLCPDIPADLDQLIMSLISADPRARPSSAAEVISLLTSIAGLLPEKVEDASSSLSSFLINPRFVGRREELARIDGALGVLFSQHHGCVVRVESMPGMGRTRLLEETTLRAQLTGAIAVRVDAGVQGHGSALETLALRLLETAPLAAREAAAASSAALRALSPELAGRLAGFWGSMPVEHAEPREQGTGSIEEWVLAICQRVPLVIAVDNVERADAATLALFAGLARRAAQVPLMLMFAERSSSEEPSLGLTTLRARCETLRLSGLSAAESLELARSLFGEEAANVERFAGWMHAQTAGTPLYVLELVRQLVERDLIRLAGGLWVLPQQRPDAALPERLETALMARVHALGADARALCSRLSLHRLDLTRELCRELLPELSSQRVDDVLEELARADVLVRVDHSYVFTNAALRDAVAHSTLEYERLDNHRALGAALLKLARGEPRLRMEAGWHLIQGGAESEGADLIMAVTCDSVAVRHMVANLYHVGKIVAAALEVYARQRRSVYERMPLLGALAHAGFYENPVWGDRYGDQALDVLQDISGMVTARRLRRYCGGLLAIIVALSIAFGRYLLTPKRERPYSFKEIITQLLSAATTLTGVAASSLDAERAQRVAEVIEPFSALPERLTPHGIYQFCYGLRQIAREQQVEATATFEVLLKRFRDPRYYPTLPPDGRVLYSSGLLFALGAFSVFRANSKVALHYADQLDEVGMKIYQMVASQIRYLYHVNRGELEAAAPHREQVELHAVHMGSAAQVERWESPALLPIGIMIGDVVGATRAAHRLQMDVGAAYLRPYRRLAEATTLLISGAYNLTQVRSFLEREISIREVRGFNGWAMTHSGIVRALLTQGDPARAESWCEAALKHINDEDREYVTLFLDLDLQLVAAQAALGKIEQALARLDALIARHEPSGHPLTLGLLHESRARIAHAAGRRDLYDLSTREAERWFRPTNTPQLIAKCERLWELGRQSSGISVRPDPFDPATNELTSAHGFRPVSARGQLSPSPASGVAQSALPRTLTAPAEVQTQPVPELSSRVELRTETSFATLLDGLDPGPDEPPN